MRPVLLFDVMGTLVYDPFFAEMPAFFGMSFDELLAEKHPSAWVEFELGRRDESSFLDDFFSDGRSFDHERFVATIAAAYRWLPGMQALLRDLAAAGCVMHAFSNYPVWYRLIEERLRLSQYIEWTFVSCRTGTRKPAAEAYAGVLQALGEPGERCVFIDDRQVNCDAAAAHGIRALRFDGADSLRSALVDHGAL